MRLHFLGSQEALIEWEKFHRDAGLHEAEINDGKVIMAIARLLYYERPDLRPALYDHADTAIEEAMGQYGMFMGIGNLLAKIGEDDSMDHINELFGRVVRN